MKKAQLEFKPEAIVHDDWDEMQDQVVSTIQLCFLDDITHQLMHLTTSKELYDKWEKMYMSRSLSSKLYHKYMLFGLKMPRSRELAAHVNSFNQIIGDLALVDVKIKDKYQAMILMCSLSSQYETLLINYVILTGKCTKKVL